jgi:hypothetical protein
MLAKVITLTHGSGGKGFGPVLRYLLRLDAQRAFPSRPTPESGHLHLGEEPFWSATEDTRGYAGDLAQIFDGQVRQCQRRGRFRGNPVYHVSINWMEGEHPTVGQAEHASRHVMQALGFGECQAVWSIHRDTGNDHVHLVVNRVHPIKLTAVSVPRRDYFLLDRCMRELELELGFAHAHGPYVTVETAEGPKIVRMSRAERQARGLLRNPNGPRVTARAQRAENNLTSASFQRWLTVGASAALHGAIKVRGATWQDAHEALAAWGCTIQPKGSGMVVTTILSNGRILAAKASLLGRWASKAALERTLGPYVEPTSESSRRPDPRKTYEKSIERERLAERRPRRSRDDPQRLARRAKRAEARRQLAERFAREQAQLRATRRQEREALRQRQEQERRTLVSAHREQRRRIRAGMRVPGRDGRIALALWAFAAAREREALQHRQASERQALTETLPRSEVWRCWLERQAAAGHEAAQAALRGIRYRERRKTWREAGIAGEEVAPQRPFTVGSLRAEVDAARQIIIYRRADGSEVFRDVGPRIVMRDKGDESLEAALRVAAQKYGGRVELSGSDRFLERAARMATRLGIVVDNPELQAIVREERRRIGEHRPEPRAAPTPSPRKPRRPRPPRSRSQER